MKIDKLSKELLAAGRKKVQLNRLFISLLSVSFILLLYAIFFIFDYLTFFPALIRIILSISIVSGTLFYIPWKKRSLLQKNSDLILLAKEFENISTVLPGNPFNSTLISAVEFALNPSIPGLQIFKYKTIEKAHSPEYSPSKLVLHDVKIQKMAIYTTVLALVTYLVFFIFFREELGVFAMRALGFQIKYPTKTKIVYIDYQKKVEQNKDAEVKIKVEGLIPVSGKAQIAFEGEDSFKIPLITEEKGIFNFYVKSPMKSFDFRIIVGDAVSDWKRVMVIPPPLIKNAKIHITPPEYTKIPPSESNLRDIEVIEKSSIAFFIESDRELKQCILELKELNGNLKEYVMEKKTPNMFELPVITAKENCYYSIKLTDTDNIQNSERIFYEIVILNDKLPIINVEKPKDGGYYSNISKMKWSFSATDDFGIREVNMLYKIILPGEGGEQKVIKQGVIPIVKPENSNSLSLTGTFNLSEIKPEILNLQFEARDNSPFKTKEQTGKSKAINLNIVSPAELKQIINSELILVGKMVEDIRADIKRQINILNLYQKSKIGE